MKRLTSSLNELLERILLSKCFARFRYPFSMPEEVGQDIGLDVDNQITFDKFINILANPSFLPSKVQKYMSRSEADALFVHAFRSDLFQGKSLFYYYFKQGWVEFQMTYDENDRLRRMVLQNKQIAEDSIEIKLARKQ